MYHPLLKLKQYSFPMQSIHVFHMITKIRISYFPKQHKVKINFLVFFICTSCLKVLLCL